MGFSYEEALHYYTSGGTMKPIEPTSQAIEFGLQTLQALTNSYAPTPFYARVDFVDKGKKDFVLMELELIEPAMYLDKTPDHVQKAFVDKLVSHLKSK